VGQISNGLSALSYHQPTTALTETAVNSQQTITKCIHFIWQ